MKKTDGTKLREGLNSFLTSLIAIVLAMIAGSILISLVDASPAAVFSALFKGAFGSGKSIVGTLNRMAPILMAGLALTVGNSASLFNIGFTGQFMLGSLFATWVGVYIKLPAVPLIALMLLAGVIGACLWAAIPTWFQLSRNVNFVFSGIMMNYIALYLCNWLIMQFPGYNAMSNATPTIQDSAKLPTILNSLGGVNSSIIIAILLVVVSSVIMFKTKVGFEMRAVGANRNAALSAGISINKRMFQAGLLSAVFAGLGGALEVMGSTYRMQQDVQPTYLVMGIAVSMLGKENPAAILVASLLFAGMQNGSTMMQLKTGVSSQFVMAVQGMLIIFICSENFITYIGKKIKAQKRMKTEV